MIVHVYVFSTCLLLGYDHKLLHLPFVDLFFFTDQFSPNWTKKSKDVQNLFYWYKLLNKFAHFELVMHIFKSFFIFVGMILHNTKKYMFVDREIFVDDDTHLWTVFSGL